MKTLNLKKLGKRIQLYRKKKGLSQETLSELIDCSPTHVSFIENGNRCVSIEMFVSLANTLHVSADDLLIDSLEVSVNAVNHLFADQIQDCSNYEKEVLMDVLTATKKSLREHNPYY